MLFKVTEGNWSPGLIDRKGKEYAVNFYKHLYTIHDWYQNYYKSGLTVPESAVNIIPHKKWEKLNKERVVNDDY